MFSNLASTPEVLVQQKQKKEETPFMEEKIGRYAKVPIDPGGASWPGLGGSDKIWKNSWGPLMWIDPLMQSLPLTAIRGIFLLHF